MNHGLYKLLILPKAKNTLFFHLELVNCFGGFLFSFTYEKRWSTICCFAKCLKSLIVPLQELTYDYGYALDSVLDSDGKIKQMPCYCGASGCRKRLF